MLQGIVDKERFGSVKTVFAQNKIENLCIGLAHSKPMGIVIPLEKRFHLIIIVFLLDLPEETTDMQIVGVA